MASNLSPKAQRRPEDRPRSEDALPVGKTVLQTLLEGEPPPYPSTTPTQPLPRYNTSRPPRTNLRQLWADHVCLPVPGSTGRLRSHDLSRLSRGWINMQVLTSTPRVHAEDSELRDAGTGKRGRPTGRPEPPSTLRRMSGARHTAMHSVPSMVMWGTQLHHQPYTPIPPSGAGCTRRGQCAHSTKPSLRTHAA